MLVQWGVPAGDECWLVWLFPVLSLLLVFFSLNPRLTMGLPLEMLNLSWTIIVAMNLAGLGGFLGYRLVVAGGHQLAGLGHHLGRSAEVAREHLAAIPALEPAA